MDVKELLKLGHRTIRTKEVYLRAFADQFEMVFNYRPKCAGCSFKSDYRKLYSHIFNEQIITNNGKMENHKINKRQRNTIHTYIDKSGKAQRSYGKNMSDDFAEKFLTTGTPEQLKERAKLFDLIPKTDEKKATEEVKETVTKDSPTQKPRKAKKKVYKRKK